MSGHSVEEIRKETRIYLTVFGALGVLTLITVGVSYLHLPVHLAIMLALAIAAVKGFLVAGFFMHLLSERKLILSILALTVLFFAVLLWGPVHYWYDGMGHSVAQTTPHHSTEH